MIAKEEWDHYASTRSAICIYKNTELGYQVYAIQVLDTDFWLCAFDKIEDAMQFYDEWMGGHSCNG